MAPFWEVLNRRSLIDMEAIGCKFTWSNKQYVNGLIKKMLARDVCNSDCRLLFLRAFVCNLSRSHGDHCPILLKLHGSLVP
ncbi:hypothetical protein REPUB_Repub05bG0072400 [Reevesia pubescens]